MNQIPSFKFASHSTSDQILFFSSVLAQLNCRYHDDEDNSGACSGSEQYVLQEYARSFPEITQDGSPPFWRALILSSEPNRYLFDERPALVEMQLMEANRKIVASIAQEILTAFDELVQLVDHARQITHSARVQASSGAVGCDFHKACPRDFIPKAEGALSTKIPLWKFILRRENEPEVNAFLEFYNRRAIEWDDNYEALINIYLITHPMALSSSMKPPYKGDEIWWYHRREFFNTLAEGLHKQFAQGLALVEPSNREIVWSTCGERISNAPPGARASEPSAPAKPSLIMQWRTLAHRHFIAEAAKSLQIALTLAQERLRYGDPLPLSAMQAAAMGNALSNHFAVNLRWWSENWAKISPAQRETFVRAITPILCNGTEPQWRQLGRIAQALNMMKLASDIRPTHRVCAKMADEVIPCERDAEHALHCLYKPVQNPRQNLAEPIKLVVYKGQLLDRLAVMHSEDSIAVYCPRPSSWEPSEHGFWIASGDIEPITSIINDPKKVTDEIYQTITHGLSEILSTWWNNQAMPSEVSFNDVMLEANSRLVFCCPIIGTVETWRHIGGFLKELYNYFGEEQYLEIVATANINTSHGHMATRNAIISRAWSKKKMEPEDITAFQKMDPAAWQWYLARGEAFAADCLRQIQWSAQKTSEEYYCNEFSFELLRNEVTEHMAVELRQFGPVEWSVEHMARRARHAVAKKHSLLFRDVLGVLSKHIERLSMRKPADVVTLCRQSGIVAPHQIGSLTALLLPAEKLSVSALATLMQILRGGATDEECVHNLLTEQKWKKPEITSFLQQLNHLRKAPIEHPQYSGRAYTDSGIASTSSFVMDPVGTSSETVK